MLLTQYKDKSSADLSGTKEKFKNDYAFQKPLHLGSCIAPFKAELSIDNTETSFGKPFSNISI